MTATLDKNLAYRDAEFVIKDVMAINPDAVMFIKSSGLVGYTKAIKKELVGDNFIFSSESLREDLALYVNLRPLRIVVSGQYRRAKVFYWFTGLLVDGVGLIPCIGRRYNNPSFSLPTKRYEVITCQLC